MSGNDNDKARLAKLEAAFEYAGGRGVELAEEIDELRETIKRDQAEYLRSYLGKDDND